MKLDLDAIAARRAQAMDRNEATGQNLVTLVVYDISDLIIRVRELERQNATLRTLNERMRPWYPVPPASPTMSLTSRDFTPR